MAISTNRIPEALNNITCEVSWDEGNPHGIDSTSSINLNRMHKLEESSNVKVFQGSLTLKHMSHNSVSLHLHDAQIRVDYNSSDDSYKLTARFQKPDEEAKCQNKALADLAENNLSMFFGKRS